MARTKEEAARFLGVSVRTLQRIAQKKRHTPLYARGKTGQKVATFDDETLSGWKDELEREATASATVAPSDDMQAVTSDTATPAQTALALAGAGRSNALLELINALSNSAASRKHEASVTDLAHKLTLSLDEAARLSGLSRGHLRQAIEEKKLKARIIGRGWRVKRDDLDLYVKKL
jgi:excisionase family DNA binding protein